MTTERQMKTNKTSRRKRQSGVALLIVLFALMLLSCIGLAMMYATNTETYIKMIDYNLRTMVAAMGKRSS